MPKKLDRRKFLKTVGKAAVVTAASGMLAGCGEPKPPEEGRIMEEVLDRDDNYSKYDINITSYKIIERDTDKSNMTDNVRFQVMGETDTFSYEATYDITYTLREKTWAIGSFDCPENQFVPLSFPTEDDAMKEIEQEDRQCVSLGQTDGDGWKEFVYSFQCKDQTYPSLSLISKIDVQFKFVPSTGTVWQAKIKNDEKIGYQFHLAGDWYYKDEECDIHMNVDESPEMMFFDDTPVLTVNSYNIWSRQRTGWFTNEREEKSYEVNQTTEISGEIYLPSYDWYFGDRSRTSELYWIFGLENEQFVVEYVSEQKDFVIKYSVPYGGYETLERKN